MLNPFIVSYYHFPATWHFQAVVEGKGNEEQTLNTAFKNRRCFFTTEQPADIHKTIYYMATIVRAL